MKKKHTSILVAISLVLLMLVGCVDNNVAEAPADTSEETEEYEKVFDYLPELTANVELDESEEPGEDNAGMGKEVYTIKDTNAEVVMDDYFEMLEEDDWELLEDHRPELIKAEKDEHEVIVVAGQVEDDVKLTIISK